MAQTCSVFISSTCEDLREHRIAVRDVVLSLGMQPVMMEYFAAGGGPPLSECLRKVGQCDLVIAIVAQRYGWVPPDQISGSEKSITWLECEHAAGASKEILVFMPDGHNPWPLELTESFRLTRAIEDGTATAELLTEVSRRREELRLFIRWLETGRCRATFTNPDDLKAKAIQALHLWLGRNPQYASVLPARRDPLPYLRWIREQTGTIDIRGLGGEKAHNFPIDELYIPLTATDLTGSGADAGTMQLQDALEKRRLVIVGDPGSGKTTFLRRIAYALAGNAVQGTESSGTSGILRKFLSIFDPARATFPILVRIAELDEHIERCRAQGAEIDVDDHAWLAHFLETQSTALGWGLNRAFFEARLFGGEAVVLLDGLDEAPNVARRERCSRLFEKATTAYEDSHFVVTTRPQSYSGQSVLSRFDRTTIKPLSSAAIDMFLTNWYEALYPESRRIAHGHRKELSEALRVRPEIRNMASNPVMLTALAVVHWNERRLPEQRADLYDSVVTWLSRQREKKAHREKAERCLTILESLALAMQNQNRGRLVSIPLSSASKAISGEFGHAPQAERVIRAGHFLEQETADSGIIVRRADEIQFWHLTFQEHLAARALAGLDKPDQMKLLLDEGKIYLKEWREVALLFAGVLLVKQGRPKIDSLISELVSRCGNSLDAQARAVGLLGAIMRDLSPLDYVPADGRYTELMDAILGVFDPKQAARIDFAVRLEAAEALGRAGDPRIERAEGWVKVGDVEIGRYPVTVQEYRRFVDDEGHADPRWWAAGRSQWQQRGPIDWSAQIGYPNRPVTGVNWYAAKAYCAWAGGRLLRDKEWHAAAGGPEGRRYPWGDDKPDTSRANCRGLGPGHPTPVGMYPAGMTPGGVQDLAGNVWEWIDDWEHNGMRSLRGGSWSAEPSDLCIDVRSTFFPDYSGTHNLGIRMARE